MPEDLESEISEGGANWTRTSDLYNVNVTL